MVWAIHTSLWEAAVLLKKDRDVEKEVLSYVKQSHGWALWLISGWVGEVDGWHWTVTVQQKEALDIRWPTEQYKFGSGFISAIYLTGEHEMPQSKMTHSCIGERLGIGWPLPINKTAMVQKKKANYESHYRKQNSILFLISFSARVERKCVCSATGSEVIPDLSHPTG